MNIPNTGARLSQLFDIFARFRPKIPQALSGLAKLPDLDQGAGASKNLPCQGPNSRKRLIPEMMEQFIIANEFEGVL